METESIFKGGSLDSDMHKLIKTISTNMKAACSHHDTKIPHPSETITEAVCENAVRLADQIQASLLFVTSHTGKTALAN